MKMTTAQKYEQAHFHCAIGQLGTVTYDYTDLLPTEAIKQYSAVAAMVDGNEYRKVGSAVAQFFLKLHKEGGMPAYIIQGEFMSEVVYKCTKPCYISPSMN